MLVYSGRISRPGRHLLSMRQNFSFLLLSLLMAARAFAADVSYAGTFSQDDEKRAFNFNLSKSSKVVIRTFSYAGGVNSGWFNAPARRFRPHIISVRCERRSGC